MRISSGAAANIIDGAVEKGKDLGSVATGAATDIIDGAVEKGKDLGSVATGAATDIIDGAVEKGKDLGSVATRPIAAARKAGGDNLQEDRRGNANKPNPKNVEALAELGRMWQSGKLTDQEFEEAKRKIYSDS